MLPEGNKMLSQKAKTFVQYNNQKMKTKCSLWKQANKAIHLLNKVTETAYL